MLIFILESVFDEEVEINLTKKISLGIYGNIINKVTIIPYPLNELKGLLISNKINQEPIYLYMPEEQYLILTHTLKLKDYHLINDKNNINKLIKDIGNYLDIFFKNYSLSSRIYISHDEKMKKIKPYFSFILEPDLKFKIKTKFTDLIKKNQNIKNEIFKIQERRNQMMNKVKIIDMLFIKKDNKNKKEPTLVEKLEYNLDEDIPNSGNKLLEAKKSKIKYRQLIRDIFTSRLNDFRKDIIEYCLDNTRYLREDNFENFVCFIEFFCLLFLGVKTKYYLDELSHLNMDFYSDEKNIMNFAESFHYQVQFRIKDIPYIGPSHKKKKYLDLEAEEKEGIIKEKKEKLKELNIQKLPSLNQDRVEFYPTFCDFSRMTSPGFRRYDLNDNYHICGECENIPNEIVCKQLKCSSCFRHIDKERLINLNLSSIMNFSKIKSYCKEKYYENEDVFIDMIINPNYEGLENRVETKQLFLYYLIPFETREIMFINKTFKDIYGEYVGFYFAWISHYVKWLFYPSLIGLVMSLISIIYNSNKNFVLVMNLIFIAFIILWGNYYNSSWEGQESFYNYIWGMNDYKLIKNSMWDYVDNSNLNYEIIMGVKIPLEASFNHWIINLLLASTLIFLHIIMMITNILIISTKAYHFNIKYKNIEFFLNNYWKFIVPILCFLLREIFSYFSEKWNKYIIKRQKQITKEQYKEIKLLMKTIFEFFNYYFNLYYIAFIKNYKGTCLNDDCHSELGDQLIIIIICDLIYTIICILIPAIYLIKQEYDLKNKINDSSYRENYSNKFIYYTRNKFEYKDMEYYYLKPALYFGYIIQFGSSAPMSFVLILITILFNRIILSISLKDIYFAQNFEESIGLNRMKKVLKILSYIGILSNLCCIFYTNNYFDSLSNGRKLIYIAITENFVLIIIKLFIYDSLPKWFYYKDKIDFTYFRKFGIREKKVYLIQDNLNDEIENEDKLNIMNE